MNYEYKIEFQNGGRVVYRSHRINVDPDQNLIKIFDFDSLSARFKFR
jgi:hypothetical protein